MAGVRFCEVEKRFGKTTVIKPLDLEVDDREFMVLVGPSGCGKSTLLRMLAGLEEVSAGTITIGDRVVNDLPPRERNIAMVFQNYALYPHMTVKENLAFGLKVRKTPRAEIERRVLDTARLLEIESLLHRRPRELSGGQRQRVAVGRAIVRQPTVFLFDEPLSNLDAKLRVQMRAELSSLQRRLATTTIYVTHDQVEAMTLGQRIAVLRDGVLHQVGPPLELYQRPADTFVASFLGTPPMNLLPAELTQGGEALLLDGVTVPLSPPQRQAVLGSHSEKVLVGIRPEHVLAGAVPGTVAVRVEVKVTEALGGEVVVHSSLAGAPLVARLGPTCAASLGEVITLSLPADRFLFFDATTSKRLPTPDEVAPTTGNP
jgi:multiple sugar transport system ATP-binding protein